MILYNYFLKKRRLFLTICVFLFTFTLSYGQSIRMENKVDTIKNQITTSIFFNNIPAKNTARWQQILSPSATLLHLDTTGILWDTSHHILTLIWEKFPAKDSFSFTFTALFTPVLPETFFWGEGALLFENTNNKIDKIKTAAQTIQYKTIYQEKGEYISDSIYFIQVGIGRNNRESDYRLYRGDKIRKIKVKYIYKYQIGPFYSEEAARERLLFYKKQVPDAFIVKEKR